MKTLQTVIITLALIVVDLSLWANTSCECGEHATGIYLYTVSGSGCCSSPIAAGSIGHHMTYIWNEGAWELDEDEQITGQAAQDECCPKT